MKKYICILLSVCLLLVFTPAVSAQTSASGVLKDEVIYALLSQDGSVKSLYAVNGFYCAQKTELVDYGDYSSVVNLTDRTALTQNGDQVGISAESGKFYYQGSLKSRELPWTVQVTYLLDGKELSAAELAGKSGSLKIRLSIKQNPSVNETFWENYALQVAFLLDASKCSGFEAEGATVADVGGSKQFTYTVLPGTGAEIELGAAVTDFEMSGISISGVRLSMDIPIDLDSFIGQTDQLVEAAKALDGGAGKLSEGADKFRQGVESYAAGVSEFSKGFEQLDANAGSLAEGIAQLRGGLSALAGGRDELVAGANALVSGTFSAANAQMAQYGLPTLTPSNFNAILSQVPGTDALRSQLSGVISLANGIESYADGVVSAYRGSKELEQGVQQLASGIHTLYQASAKLFTGAKELQTAAQQLREGITEYAGGVSEFASETAKIPDQIRSTVDELMDGIFGNGDPVVSFTSEKNGSVEQVQFVLKTAAIEKPEVSVPVVAEKKLTFWQKLLALFGIK